MKNIILFFSLFILSTPAFSGDIAVSSVRLTYQDNVTTPGKFFVRELKSFQDDTYWSKPNEVDVTVEIENVGSTVERYIHVNPELYYQLSASGSSFPPLKGELRTITKLPVWVWINTLGSMSIPELQPGEKKKLVFNKVQIRSQYYATDYHINAVAIRVFAVPRDGDSNYVNNVMDKVVPFGD
ncbi:MAG: hypothetical protein ACYC7L_10590 [Nitrospirota bacterium]